MKGRACKQKGKQWEEAVAKKVGLWYYDDARALDRTKGSRSRSAFRDQKGDIGVARSGLKLPWALSIECKAHEKWTIESLLDIRKANPVLKFWKQCRLDAKAGRKLPWLVVKKNWAPPILITRNKYMEALEVKLRLVYITKGLAIARLNTVLEQTSPNQWIDLWRVLYHE